MPILKGADKLRAHLPDFPRVLKHYALATIVSAVVGLSVVALFDNLPRFLPDTASVRIIAPLSPVMGICIIEIVEFSAAHRMWTRRAALLAKMQERAYQHALLYVCFGINIEYVVVTRMYLPTPGFGEIGRLLATPLLSFVPGLAANEWIVRVVAGLACLAIGFALLYRSVMAFGVDYLLYMYLYFPGESEIQRSAIYSIVRHPTYLGFVLMCFGGALTWFSVYSFAFSLIVAIRWGFHVRFVEEEELIERFGEPYRQYRREVPAFFVFPKRLAQFFRFLFGRP